MPAIMSQPRHVKPGAVYLITRRTVLRHKLLRPDEQMNQIIEYLLAVSADRFGMEVHAFCVMSTHIHMVLTDVRGKLPKFLGFFHRMVANCTKVYRGWKDPVWDKRQTSAVRLMTSAAVVEEIAYTLANPVTEGLVRRAHQWPGAKVVVGDIGRGTVRVARPKVYLREGNPDWPAEASLPITLPPGVDPSRGDAFCEQVAAELERLESAAHARMAEERRSFLGIQRSCLVPPASRATTPEPAVDRNPYFAVGRGQGDAWQRAAEALRAFRLAYRVALTRWRWGIRDVVFPAGTWAMGVYHSAVVAAPGVEG